MEISIGKRAERGSFSSPDLSAADRAEAIRRPGGRPFVSADEICTDASSLVPARNR